MVNSLNETIELMTSSDYKDRFKAEFYQLEYRYNKLMKMLDDWNAGTLSFSPTCSYNVLETQVAFMEGYLETLKERAEIEKIEL